MGTAFSLTFLTFKSIIGLIMKQSPSSITVMKHLGVDGEYHFVMADDLKSPSLEDRLNYLNKVEYNLWANGEIIEHVWTRTSSNCEVVS